MKYVYLLSDYDEYGAEHVAATLDRARLLDLVDANWTDASEEFREIAKKELASLLERLDIDLLKEEGNGHSLHHGWGGAQLHVVQLY